MSEKQPLKLRTMLGDYDNVIALKDGRVKSSSVTLDFNNVPVPNKEFKAVVRGEYDVAELAIATYLQAKAWDKNVALLPLVIVGGKAQHAAMVYNADRGHVAPKDIVGKRVAIRASSQTTVMWIRGILKRDYGVDIDNVKWMTFEDPHVPEYKDPSNCERVAPGKKAMDMLLSGEVVAACLSGDELKHPGFKPLIPEPQAAAKEWNKSYNTMPINHMLVVKKTLLESNPAAVQEVFRMVSEARKAAGMPAAGERDPLPIGLEANRNGLKTAIDYAHAQQLIPRPFTVDELFTDVTRKLGA